MFSEILQIVFKTSEIVGSGYYTHLGYYSKIISSSS